MVDKELLDILACPACKSPVVPREKEGKEYLQCEKCRRLYPVREGIPVMLAEESEPGESGGSGSC